MNNNLDYITIITLVASMMTNAKQILLVGEKLKNKTFKQIGTNIQEDATLLLDEMVKEHKKGIGNPNFLNDNEIELLTQLNGKIPAIKALRERTGLGLVDAKNKVEDYMLQRWGHSR